MRKYLFILFLLTAVFSAKAQQPSYQVELHLWYNVEDPVKNDTEGHLYIDLTMQDGSKRRLYSRALREEGDKEEEWTLEYTTVNSLPRTVRLEGFVNFRGDRTDAKWDETRPVLLCDWNDYWVDPHSPNMYGIYCSVKITPLPSIFTAASLLPDNDRITLNASPGYPSGIYNWEYSLDGSNYNALPYVTGNPGNASVNVSLTDLVGSRLDLIKANTFFQLKACPNVPSNRLTLNNRLSSPHITGVTYEPNKCYGETNGSVKIQFDRALLPGEWLNIFLNDASPTGYHNSAQNLPALEPGNTYTWPSELPPGNYSISLVGKYPDPSVSTYTEGATHYSSFSFAGPAAVDFSTDKRDVYCHNGSDATITVNATGGVGNYMLGYKKVQESDYSWLPFSTAGSHTITGLDTGTYNIRIYDGNHCIKKNASGNEVIGTVTISQPAEPLHVDNAQTINPLAYGYTDGSIRTVLTGGTPVGGASYNVQWTRFDGTALTPEPATTNPFTTQMKNIGNGQYILIATDANYALTSGANAVGCISKDTFTLVEPPPLIVTVSEHRYVSCKNAADGKLYAKAEGGIEIPIFRYKYRWFRKDNGVWTDIQQTDSIAVDLIAGVYKIIITDKNNIDKESDTFKLEEPNLLTLAVSSTPLNCNASNNGTASAAINGGTQPYKLEWTTGETTNTISNLASGNYKAFVTDARGCQTEQQVKVSSPNPIEIRNAVVKNPTCYKGADGVISYTTTGGTIPYTYNWSNGATAATLNNLPAGDYKLTITDSKGCPLTQTFTVNETPLVVIGLQDAVTLCTGQVYEANATITNGITYQWTGTNGFTASTADVKLTNEGTYYVTATNSNGCIGKDTIGITRSNAAVAAEMLVTTQAFTNDIVTFVNISNPAPEKVEWLLPHSNIAVVSLNDQEAQVKFTDTGLFTIGMRTRVGACEKTVSQPITIVQAQQFDQPGTTTTPYITAFTVGPNPSTGQFTVKIGLQEAGSIRLRLINLNTGALVHQQQQTGSKQYQLPYNLPLTTGVYSLILETAKEYRIVKVMIL